MVKPGNEEVNVVAHAMVADAIKVSERRPDWLCMGSTGSVRHLGGIQRRL